MENYTQSGIISPIASKAVSRTLTGDRKDPVGQNDTKPDNGSTTGTAVVTAAACKAERNSVSALDYAFFYAREYWWAVAIASFLLGMWYNKKGA